MKISRQDFVWSIVIGGFIGGILAHIIRDLITLSEFGDPLTEFIGVLLGAIILGSILIYYIERHQ